MNNRLNLVCLGGLLALTSLLTQPALADEWNKRSEFHFSVPVEIPGKVLSPGKYFFQIQDLDTFRNVVQVFSEDSNGNDSLVTTVIARSVRMSNAPDNPTLIFQQSKYGTPEAIHSWFYPVENLGWAFVYPGSETRETGANTAALHVTAQGRFV